MIALHSINYGVAAAGTTLILGAMFMVSPASPFPGRRWVTRAIYGAHWLLREFGCFAHFLDMGVKAYRELRASTPINLACEAKGSIELAIDFDTRPFCNALRAQSDTLKRFVDTQNKNGVI